MHNGYVADFGELRRELMLALDPERFSDVEGSTDTEVLFHLALTFGLTSDPITALERTVALVENVARRRGTEVLVQSTFGVSDGECLWAVRYATEGTARSLYASTDPEAIRALYPDDARLQRLSADDRLIVSEPFSDLPGVWREIGEGTATTVRRGGVLEERPFVPHADPAPAGGELAGARRA